MNKLTDRQTQILDCIREQITVTNMPPTRSEIAAALGFSSLNSVEQHLKALVRKGFIELIPKASRGIRILREDLAEENGLPVIGRVAAGQPILAAQHIEDHYPLLPGMFRPDADYLLRVCGMSMRDIGIFDGDLLAVHSTKDVTDGQVVVARVDDGVTVKRFRRKGDQVSLLPENPEHKPIMVDLRKQTLTIEGLGVGVLRNRGSL
ncbi:MAG: repressor LexA [Gammaproteobacteria bacterium]|nr:repressor LexA [Gammaproteobacteria bacterium]